MSAFTPDPGEFVDPVIYVPFSLTTKLPFEDDEFDHIHVSMIAKGVPENKVNLTFRSILSWADQVIVGKPLRGECGVETAAIKSH